MTNKELDVKLKEQLEKYTKLEVNTIATCYSYTMGMSGLPDMYTRSPRAAGPRAEGVHIRQTTNAHGITVMCHIAPPLAN